jgi:hypothetical protein
MRRTAVLCLLLCAAFAQEDPRARARDLELAAEKALDEGRRADALKLLNEAADLRAKARAVKEPVPLPANPATADVALKEMDLALGKGDAAMALKAGLHAREALAGWAKDLEARERRLAEGTPVEKRVTELERRVEDLSRRAGK